MITNYKVEMTDEERRIAYRRINVGCRKTKEISRAQIREYLDMCIAFLLTTKETDVVVRTPQGSKLTESVVRIPRQITNPEGYLRGWNLVAASFNKPIAHKWEWAE